MDSEHNQPTIDPESPVVNPEARLNQPVAQLDRPTSVSKPKNIYLLIVLTTLVASLCLGAVSLFWYRNRADRSTKDEYSAQSVQFPLDNSCYRLGVSESELFDKGLRAVGPENDNPLCVAQLVYVESTDSKAMVFEMLAGDDSPELGAQAFRSSLVESDLDFVSEEVLTINNKPAKLLVHQDKSSVSGVGYTAFVATPEYYLGGDKSTLLMIYGDYTTIIEPMLRDLLAKIEFK